MGLRESAPFVWHVLVCTGVLAFASLVLATVIRRWSARERWLAAAGLVAQSVASFVLLYIIMEVYGVGDVVTFFRQGELLVRYIDLRGLSALWEVVRLVFQDDVRLPFPMAGAGSPTGSMAGFGGLVLLVTRSIWGGNLFVALLSFCGRVAIYAALRPQFDEKLRTRLIIAMLLVPSVSFWSGGLVKEAVTLWGLGWLILGLYRIDRGSRLGGLCWAAAGAVPVALSKPYILLPLVLAAGGWLYWRAGLSRDENGFGTRPLRVGLAVAVASLGVVLIGELFPAYSVENLSDQVALHQLHGSQAGGGSYFEIGALGEQRGLLGQLAYAPIALITACYRPFLFEVANPLMLVNAIESTALLILTGFVLTRAGLAWSVLRRSPALMFCLSFTIMTSIGLGVTSTNLGTLSRYRILMMPFFVVVLLVLHAAVRRARVPAGAAGVDQDAGPHARATLRSTASQRSTRRPSS